VDTVKSANAAGNAWQTATQADNATGAVRSAFGFCSFSADTLVSTLLGPKAIGEIEIGDLVLAYNEHLQSTGYYTVTATWGHEDTEILYLVVDGDLIVTTPDHLFFTVDGDWIEAGDLSLGDQIREADNEGGTVEAKLTRIEPRVMYNLTVAEAHTYFVGTQQWLVHNDCWKIGPGGWGPPPAFGPGYVRVSQGAPGYDLAVMAKGYYAKITRTKFATFGLGEFRSGQLTDVFINNGAGRGAANQAGAILVPTRMGHPDRYILEHFGTDQIARIGISNYAGPCKQCYKFFESMNFWEVFYLDNFIDF